MSTVVRIVAVVIVSTLSAYIARAVPVYLLTQNNFLVTMDSASPSGASAPVAITGTGSFQIVGIDIRTTVQTVGAANSGVGSLWALGIDGANAQVFVINPATAVATPVGPVLSGIDGTGSGDNGWFFGHDPGSDRFRMMNFVNNYLLDPNTITYVQQSDLMGFPNVTIQVPSAFARRSPSCLGDRIKAVSVSSMGSDCFRALAMTLLRSQNALA